MSYIAELGISINSKGADQASKELDNLAKSSVNAQQAVESLGETEEQAAARLRKVSTAAIERVEAKRREADATRANTRELSEEQKALIRNNKAIDAYNKAIPNYTNQIKQKADLAKTNESLYKSEKDLTKETLKAEKEFNALLKAIDPVQSKLNSLDKQVESLGKHFDSGKITQSQYEKGLSSIERQYAELEKGTRKYSLQTKQARTNVLQLLGALKSGNWTSAARNISELGISAGSSATSLFKLAAPIGLVVGALSALGYAYLTAEREAKAFRRAIYLTGNFSGSSVSSLNKIAADLSGGNISQNKAALTLAQITEKGKFTEEQLKKVASTALQLNAAFDIPIDQTISKFEQLADSPTQAVLKLNEQYHFLTSAVYEQIRALEQQGDKTGAANLAMQTFASAQQEAANKGIKSAGYLERSWNAVKGAINGATEAALSFGRGSSDPTAPIRNKINDLRNERFRAVGQRGFFYSDKEKRDKWDKTIKEIDNAIAEQEKELESVRSTGKTTEQLKQINNAQIEQRIINASSNINEVIDTLKTPKERMKKEIDDLNRSWAELYDASQGKGIKDRSGLLNGVTRDDNGKFHGGAYDKSLQRILDKYKNKDSIKSPTVGDDNATRLIQQLKEQEAVLKGQLSSTEKLGTAQQQLIRFEEQIANLKEKKTLTADQKSLLASEDRLRSQYKINSALEKEAKLKKESLDQKQWASALDNELESKQRQVDLSSATVWMGSRDSQEYKEVEDVKYRYAKQKKILADAQRGENALTQESYNERVALLDEAMTKEVAIVKKGQANKRKAEENWIFGANSSYQNYLEEARNVAKQTEGLFTNGFNNMENSLVSFVRTGKLSFKSFANSVLDDLARIGVRMATSSALQAVFGSALGGLFGNYAGASKSLDGMVEYSPLFGFQANAKGGVYDVSGIKAFAKGGAFTNAIVDKPTLFPFAKGIGLMGEAEPEAIMPLTRTSDGSLGVRMVSDQLGSNGRATTNPQVNIVINNDGSGSVTTSQGYEQMGQEMYRQIQAIADERIMYQKQQGGVLDPNSRR